jgi:hypothetical protein
LNNLIQISRGRRRVVFLILAALAASLPRATVAHDLFTGYIQHGVRLAVGARHVDLTIDLTFFEEWSAKERLAMDTDNNGRISRSEVEAYVKKIAPRISQQVKLHVAGREVALAPLYDPEVDLLSDDKVGPAHHRLRLFFFAVTPAEIRAADDLVVGDSLWLKAKALGTLQAEGQDGATLEARPVGDSALAPTKPTEARRFTFRCLKPPTAASEAQETVK